MHRNTWGLNRFAHTVRTSSVLGLVGLLALYAWAMVGPIEIAKAAPVAPQAQPSATSLPPLASVSSPPPQAAAPHR